MGVTITVEMFAPKLHLQGSTRARRPVCPDGTSGIQVHPAADTYIAEDSLNWLVRWAVTKGVTSPDHVLDDFPDVPDFIVDAADVTKSPR
jgi:hypothetical protein